MRASFPSAAAPLMWAALTVPALAQDDADQVRALERRTQEIKQTAAPAVVFVTVTTRADPLPRLVFPGFVIAAGLSKAEHVEGTGFFLAERGVLVTTMDLVRDAARIEVRFGDGSARDASLVGTDSPFRMAVLRTSPPPGVDALRCADRVEAVPSTIAWFIGSNTSALSASRAAPAFDVQLASVRPAPEQGAAYDRFLYAPIAIARGAAGGPLVGGDGSVLGMAVGSLVAHEGSATSNMRFPRATLFVRGDDIVSAVRQILRTGRVDRPMLGAMMEGDTNRIETLLAGSPAEAAGFADGDTIVKVGCHDVSSYADITRALLRRRAADPVRVTVERGGEFITRKVELAPFAPPPEPTHPPLPGATIEVSPDAEGEPVFTLVDVAGGTLAAKAGLRVGDRVLSVDDSSIERFLRRHRARPSRTSPASVRIERAGEPLDLALPVE